MMGLMLTLALALVGLATLVVHRRHQIVAWNRELERAFDAGTRRDISLHRRL